MNTAEVTELRKILVDRCPGFAGIDVEHLGRYRVRVNAVTFDAVPMHLVMSLADDDAPMGWAITLAKAMNRGVRV